MSGFARSNRRHTSVVPLTQFFPDLQKEIKSNGFHKNKGRAGVGARGEWRQQGDKKKKESKHKIVLLSFLVDTRRLELLTSRV